MNKKNRIVIALTLVLISTSSYSDSSKNINNSSKMTEKEKTEFITEFAKAMGQKVDPNDPKTIQAAEAFLVADAGKAYAFTKIHGLAQEFCKDNSELNSAMSTYKDKAKSIIALGNTYYQDGFDLQLGEKKMKKTGKELTDGLNEMLEGMREEYSLADEKQLKRKCNESTEALNILAMVYGG